MNQSSITSHKDKKKNIVEKVKENDSQPGNQQDTEKGKLPWQLVFLIVLIAVGLLGLLLKGFSII